VEQRRLVPSHDNAPFQQGLELPAVLGKKQHDSYPSSSLFTQLCAMRLFPVPSHETPDEGNVLLMSVK